MSTRFDDEVQASWARFEAQLGDALAVPEVDPFAVRVAGEPGEEGAPCVQFLHQVDAIHAMVPGFERLDERSVLDDVQQEALLALGWSESVHGTGEWWCLVPAEEAPVVVSMVAATFRRVFGVADPSFLASDRLWPSDGSEDTSTGDPGGLEESTGGGGDSEGDGDVEAVIGLPDDYDHLVEMVRRSLAPVYGDDLVRDDDGDFPISTGTVPLWVRVHRDRPLVQVFSYVVSAVRNVRQARLEIGILNHRQDLLKFVLANGAIMASYSLPAVPFAGAQLVWALDHVEEQLEDLARDAALRVGGRLWFDAMPSATTDQEESA